MTETKKGWRALKKQVQWRRYFTALLSNNWSKDGACKEIGVSRRQVDRWEHIEGFKELKDEWFAKLEDGLIEVAVQRAKSKSDTLLIFLLKAARPARFDEGVRKQVVANQGLKEALESLPALEIINSSDVPETPAALIPYLAPQTGSEPILAS